MSDTPRARTKCANCGTDLCLYDATQTTPGAFNRRDPVTVEALLRVAAARGWYEVPHDKPRQLAIMHHQTSSNRSLSIPRSERAPGFSQVTGIAITHMAAVAGVRVQEIVDEVAPSSWVKWRHLRAGSTACKDPKPAATL